MRTFPTEAVVAGFDGSTESRRAVWWAALEATTRSQPLLVVHAFAVPLEELTRIHLPSEAVALEPMRNAAERTVDGMAAECRRQLPGLDVRTTVRLGHPATVLTDAAAHASVLVLGPPTLSRTRRVLLGSTAAEVVRTAHVPVVVVRGEREHVQALTPAFERIVVGVDGSECSVRAVGFAYDFAARHDSELTAVLAYTEQPPDALPPNRGWRFDSDMVEAGRRELSEALAGWGEHYPDVAVHQNVTAVEHPAEALLTAAVDADLLVVGTHGRGVVRTALLGSVSHAVVHYAACPVAVVR
ncbi:universal stress protein [Saccharopolyspora phatthalungensis]|uniref:Nucleotide-binding universal stress UspA family protein n=1 Tax=Saccharopolyspora phatthalungensis TaxID=664693 RepID=A0A840QG93_9PSEU|nr:universal stress protein [Saccharopolyspora phatthalungensis]MBB5157535.1 nucleotide-binding universal stress UspA family protein [Saccharopolyspora phatthalungensis]